MPSFNAELAAETEEGLRSEVQDLEAKIARLESRIEDARGEIEQSCRQDLIDAETGDPCTDEEAVACANSTCPSLFPKEKTK